MGCIILGRGEDDAKVREWLSIAAAVPGFIGFAVGRTSFWDPLVNWLGKNAHEWCVGELVSLKGMPSNDIVYVPVSFATVGLTTSILVGTHDRDKPGRATSPA